MPIPYLGSKSRGVKRIYNLIRTENLNSNVLVDLFCGGCAVAEYFRDNGWEVFANDLNKYTIALAQEAQKGLDEAKCLEWVSRDKFFNVLQNPENYEDWYVGYVANLWSFGNCQRTYMFGKNIEKYKQAGFELVVNDNPGLLLEIKPELVKQFYLDLREKNDTSSWRIRRLVYRNSVKKVFGNVEQLRCLETLQSLQRLERLQSLESVKYQETLFTTTPITFTNLDYRQVNIPAGAIIYCDPPYLNKSHYKVNKIAPFNHSEFWNWVRQKSKTNNVYVSEYQAPDDFIKVREWKQSTALPPSGRSKNQPNECVFVYEQSR